MRLRTHTLSLLVPLVLFSCNIGSGVEVQKQQGRVFYDLQTRSLEGQPVDLGQYRGRVALVVNTASKCGYTPQYEGLQALQERYADQDFVVLGFPSNDFLGQEPGTPQEIRAFCTERFGVTFPMFEKVQVKAGEGQSEIYQLLGETTGTLPSWNFGKYLVDRSGAVVQFFGTQVKPTDPEITGAIESHLAGPGSTPAAAASSSEALPQAATESAGPRITLESHYADFPQTLKVAGQNLTLNGSALCEWGLLGFNLYRGALYVERTSQDAETLMQVDQIMVVYLYYVRSLSRSQLQDAFRASVHYQVGEDSDQETNLNTLLDWMVDVNKGDAMAFVVDDAQALQGFLNGKPMGQISDPAFAKLFVQLYLGNKPPTEALKKGMLGK